MTIASSSRRDSSQSGAISQVIRLLGFLGKASASENYGPVGLVHSLDMRGLEGEMFKQVESSSMMGGRVIDDYISHPREGAHIPHGPSGLITHTHTNTVGLHNELVWRRA